MAGNAPEVRKPKSLEKSRIQNEETAVQSIISTIESMINPFDASEEELVCLSSGIVATDEVKMDYLTAQDRGKEALTAYLNDQLLAKKDTIFSPIKKI